ncbi:3-galactosyl-N-acetylglucosaminide 4-alpha-L-fucosyltransferase FUT3-like [Saccostrea echinata]|uniref:3-galactosyl-N-acetylglucosaminide 4-alpha-L-fucosyltransferase FUT3-like n=1 Tax=Saccostrea echinata TaxID=191078 RepID=UPI002A7F8B68|nr:3-galactosyl-N-acetylglucosaminide 4-alpha-L-fucosyltransferase FUT3-like [Saccostrea echinata]
MLIPSSRCIKKYLFFCSIVLFLILVHQFCLPYLVQEHIFPVSKRLKKGIDWEHTYIKRNISFNILYYNPPKDWKKGPDIVNFRDCPYKDCSVTTDKSQLKNCKAVIFQHRPLPEKPPLKFPRQIWIFTSSESPYHTDRTVLLPAWDGAFDWSLSYRRDSDAYFGYGQIIPRISPLVRDYDLVFSQKVGDVAWIVSNCRTRSKREKYVEELQKYVNVDVFGKCGAKCEPYQLLGNDSCHRTISRDYKFYLSFENSLCIDYTSEKLYHIYLLDFPIIPVVRGTMTGKQYIPVKTYIDTLDFKTPRDLAETLKKIGNNKTQYINMLRAKDMERLSCLMWRTFIIC